MLITLDKAEVFQSRNDVHSHLTFFKVVALVLECCFFGMQFDLVFEHTMYEY
jgi:hypothetical protein